MEQGQKHERSGMLPIESSPRQNNLDWLQQVNIKNAWRILPFVFAGYMLNFLDKSNVGMAALEMNRALGFSATVFGFGAGVFFLSYTLFEVPSNLMMRWLGARAWLGCILVLWGLISAATAFTQGRVSFYALRVALGAAEAGWVPGVVFYLCCWFPRAFRARALTMFYLGTPVSAIIGYPIGGALLGLPRTMGFDGWQWLFIIEGIPAIVLGIIALIWLRNRPANAGWLSTNEKNVLARALDAEAGRDREQGFSILQILFERHVLFFAFVNFLFAASIYGILMWLPRLVKAFGGLTNVQTGFISAIPFLCGAIASVICAISSDRIGERKWHVAGMFFLGAVAMGCTTITNSALAMMVCISIAMVGSIGVAGVWYAMVTDALTRLGGNGLVAVGVAVVMMIGNLSGFVVPYTIGLLLDAFGNFRYALMLVSALLFIAGFVIALSGRDFLSPLSPRGDSSFDGV
jgi:ACS family tartrate transporter-like MFS transporter